MCLHPRPIPPIPEQTRYIGERLFKPESLARMLGDEFSDVVSDEQFAPLYSNLGQPVYSPATLAMVTILQADEHSSDRIAAFMVVARMDWKYALHLPLDDAGFDASVLCEYRYRLVTHDCERMCFDAFLQALKDRGWLQGRKRQRTDSTAILGAIRELNRLELVMETLRLALEDILEKEPAWFAAHVPDAWVERYAQWTQAERIVKERGPKGEAKTQALLIQTGRDGFALLDALCEEDAPHDLSEIDSVIVMTTVWLQQYQRVAQGVKPVVLPIENQLCEEMAAVKKRARQREDKSTDGKGSEEAKQPESPEPENTDNEPQRSWH